MAAQLRQGSLAVEESANGGTALAGVTGRRGLDEWRHGSGRGHWPSRRRRIAARHRQGSLADCRNEPFTYITNAEISLISIFSFLTVYCTLSQRKSIFLDICTMKSSGENVILREIFHAVSCFPLYFLLYRGNLDYFSDSERTRYIHILPTGANMVMRNSCGTLTTLEEKIACCEGTRCHHLEISGGGGLVKMEWMCSRGPHQSVWQGDPGPMLDTYIQPWGGGEREGRRG